MSFNQADKAEVTVACFEAISVHLRYPLRIGIRRRLVRGLSQTLGL
jgi:hypothetical protein